MDIGHEPQGGGLHSRGSTETKACLTCNPESLISITSNPCYHPYPHSHPPTPPSPPIPPPIPPPQLLMLPIQGSTNQIHP
uniref:Uncharacterized protein n=1 Tax=Vespula pensylvanica TaxID=30213 RepID=A0A834P0A6_VESPE|nr:hypothetical protein H0235_008493 [Vespula pensylvanica]